MDLSDKEDKYQRRFDLKTLVFMGVGNTIGVGVFALTGLAAKYAGGAAVWIAYIVAGVVCVLTALVYAEFGSKIPKSGSSYVYS